MALAVNYKNRKIQPCIGQKYRVSKATDQSPSERYIDMFCLHVSFTLTVQRERR
jgi:hypothetical protein